jgi:RND family efflux transporter MFP subunit
MNKKNIIITTLASTIILTSCGSDVEKNTTNTVAVNVKTEMVKSTEQFTEHRFSGKIKADDKTVLSTKIIGQIENILVKEGDKVSKGQLLVKIKSNDLTAKQNTASSGVKAAQLNMENTAKNFQRVKNLHQKGSATIKELEDMTVANQAAIAAYNEAKHQQAEINDYLSYANLKSPINGFVSSKMSSIGDMAKPGFPVLVLESLTELKIELNVPEFEIAKFELEDNVSIDVDVANLKAAKGKVDRIIPSSSSGQFKVIVSLTENSNLLKPGMFARVNLLKDKEQVLLINKSLIIKKGQLTGIYTVSQQQEAMLRWVRLGKEYGDKVEVLSGLIEGEQLITSSTSKLTDGALVK